MQRILKVFLTCLVLLPIYIMTACSDPAEHISKITLINDLGRQAELSLCKDDLHCESIEQLWPPKRIDAKDTQSFAVSNEEATVFKVSSEINGKTNVRCLRIRLDESLKTSHDLLLSSATDC
jgi:hypothetical protein